MRRCGRQGGQRRRAGTSEEENQRMTRSTSLPLRLAALLGSAAIIAACTGTTASPSAAPASEAPSPSAAVSEAPYEGIAYPADGEAPCGTEPYTGLFKKITAVDRVTVEFQLCNP